VKIIEHFMKKESSATILLMLVTAGADEE